MDDLEVRLNEVTSLLTQLCNSFEKQTKQLKETSAAAANISKYLSESSTNTAESYPVLSDWLLNASSCTSRANILHSAMVRSWNDKFLDPMNTFLKEYSKEYKNAKKQQVKASGAYESAETKVKLCREKGKQTKMIKLMELEQERDVCQHNSELAILNKTAVLKRSQENMQVELLQGLYHLIDSYSLYFKRGNDMMEQFTSKLPELHDMITEKRHDVLKDVMNYVTTTTEQLHIASDLALSSDKRLIPQPSKQFPDTIPINLLPEEIGIYFKQRKFAISTSGKLKSSAQEAEIDLTKQPAVLIVTNLKDQTSVEKPVDQILQICRKKEPKKLKLQWTQKEKESEIVFADIEQRERFYECLTFAHNCYLNALEPEEDIRIWMGSWNMGDAPPPSEIDDWIPKIGFDLYVIGVQECEYKPKGNEDSENTGGCEADWFGRIQNHLGTEFIRVCGLSLMSIRLIVLVHRKQWFKISNVRSGTEACGIANIVGNKGAVGISFMYNETRFIFINSHLAAHMNKWEDRNQNFRQIVANLKLISQNPCSLTNYYHHVFWLGDLNYRLEDDRDNVLNKISSNQLEDLFLSDQLTRERVWGNAFAGFSEGTLTFPPTYRYCRNSNEYSEEKLRVPSWCDRILWKSLPNCIVRQEEYSSTETILTSDHHPIYSTFKVTTKKSNLPHIPSSCCVYFSKLEASGVVDAKDNSIIDTSLLFICDSFTQSQMSQIALKSSNPKWDSIQPIELFTTNKEHLVKEYVFIIVREHGKKKDQTTLLGQGVVSLKDACGDEPIAFDCKLQYRGKIQGKLYGMVHVKWETDIKSGLDIFTQKKGYLLKQRRRKKVSRMWFVLANNCLYYYESESLGKLNGSISLRNATVTDGGSEKPTQFKIETQKKTLLLSASSAEDKQDWLELLQVASTSGATPSDTESPRDSPRKNVIIEEPNSNDITPTGSPNWSRSVSPRITPQKFAPLSTRANTPEPSRTPFLANKSKRMSWSGKPKSALSPIRNNWQMGARKSSDAAITQFLGVDKDSLQEISKDADTDDNTIFLMKLLRRMIKC